MAPAKATRPGFRQSIAVGSDGKGEAQAVHLFHPVYHTYSTPIRSRIDVDRIWPSVLADEDSEELIDTFSEPPQFAERLSPVSVQFGDIILKAHNWTELRIKSLRRAIELYDMIGRFIESTLKNNGGGSRIPFSSISLDPDTVHRIIEMDYESGESTYQQLMKLFAEGTVAPGLTTPFQGLLPSLSQTELRIIARITFTFYSRILKKYHAFLKRNNEDGLMVIPFWVPESAFNRQIAEVLDEEWRAYCKKERFGAGHLVFMLDSQQAEHTENDVLMKSWNLLHEMKDGKVLRGTNGTKAKSRRKNGAGSLHAAHDSISVVFRDRNFSDWVAYSNPSVKKLLDRTIAKVDSDLNAQGVHYGWGHFEDLDALMHSPKSVINFKQKLVKLAELGYVPLSPDFYIRGKLRGQLGYAEGEPLTADIRENTAGGDWHEHTDCYSRWSGYRIHPDGEQKLVAPDRKYARNTVDGKIEEEGPQCWKLAWCLTRETCADAVIGDLDTLKGGMAEILAGFVGGSNQKRKLENVHEFLIDYAHVYWREHFIQHDLSEADINIHEMVNKQLRAGLKPNLTEADAAICSAAAQAIYFAFDTSRVTGTAIEHMDQRAFYQCVSMMTLALSNTVYVHHWMKNSVKAGEMVELIKTELIGFETAYQRYQLSKAGVRKKSWEKALESHISDSKWNVVKRCATRIAAIHLRPIGFTKEFSREDELITPNVGHFWSTELDNLNCKYENPYFCGVREV